MKKSELINSINAIIKNGNKICKESKGTVSDGVLKRLKKAKSALLSGNMDAIEYRDILDIDMNNCQSYADLRNKNIDNYKLVKGFRKLSISIFNSKNQFKGEYIYLNLIRNKDDTCNH